MNSPMGDRYGVRLAVVVLAWITIVSVVVFADHTRWRRLTSQVNTSTLGRQVVALESRVAALETEIAALQRQPIGVSAERFATHSKSWEERLARLEQRGTESASKLDVAALSSRMNTLEAWRVRAVRSRSISGVVSKLTPPAKGTVSDEPPFHVIGPEQRGGETFLAVSPPNATSLAQVSVLRVGDTQDGWQLVALEGKSATFRVDGQLRRLELP